MNLQENIQRIKKIMGLLVESTDTCCKREVSDPSSVYSFWSDKTKTDEEKSKEIENLVNPYFTKAIDYYKNYVKGEWFTKKINEILQNYNTKNDESKRITWDDKQVQNLESFLNSIKLVYQLNCELGLGGQVKQDKYDTVIFCVRITWPKDSSSNWYQILIHELKHSIVFYFENLGVSITPQSEVLQYEAGTDYESFKEKKYTTSTKENSSRIQNMRNLLGVDDFVSVENLKNLLEKSLTAKPYNDLQKNLDIKYSNNSLSIYTNFIFENKNPFSGYIILYLNGEKSLDISPLFSNFYTVTKSDSGDIVTVDIEKLFTYSQQFANLDNKSNINYG